MILWLDAQLSPQIAPWINTHFAVDAVPVRDVGLREANDVEIFQAARTANAIVMTKDSDFVNLLDRFGPPPRIIWLTCGNTSNQQLRAILSVGLPQALELLAADEPLVEISAQ